MSIKVNSEEPKEWIKLIDGVTGKLYRDKNNQIFLKINTGAVSLPVCIHYEARNIYVTPCNQCTEVLIKNDC